MTTDHDTVDMFPELPRDPKPAPEDMLPAEVRKVVDGLRKMAKPRHLGMQEKLLLEKAADLLTESWRNAI